MLRDLIIYYVDDDPEDLDVFAEIAIAMDVEVVPINESDEIASKVGQPYNGSKIIFLDVNMPVKSGYDLLTEIRHSKELNQLPIVAFSTGNDDLTVKKCWDFGADLFIQKANSLARYKEILGLVKSINWQDFKRSPDRFVFKA